MTAAVDDVATAMERLHAAASARVSERIRIRRRVVAWLVVSSIVLGSAALIALAPVSWRAWATSFVVGPSGSVPGDAADATVLSDAADATILAWTAEIVDGRAYVLATVQVRIDGARAPMLDVRARWSAPPEGVATDLVTYAHDTTPLMQAAPTPMVLSRADRVEFGPGQRCSIGSRVEEATVAWCDVDVVFDIGPEGASALPDRIIVVDHSLGIALADLVLEREDWRWHPCDLGRCSSLS